MSDITVEPKSEVQDTDSVTNNHKAPQSTKKPRNYE